MLPQILRLKKLKWIKSVRQGEIKFVFVKNTIITKNRNYFFIWFNLKFFLIWESVSFILGIIVICFEIGGQATPYHLVEKVLACNRPYYLIKWPIHNKVIRLIFELKKISTKVFNVWNKNLTLNPVKPFI